MGDLEKKEKPLYEDRHASLSFKQCDISIERSRWAVYITITFSDGTEKEYVSSADSFYTDQDEIWFGTKKEYDEYEDW